MPELHHRPGGDLPVAQLTGAVTRRLAGPGDAAFLRGLDAAVLGERLAALGDAAADLVALQARARRADRATRFPAAREEVVLLGGEPVGAVLTDVREDEVRVVDLALVPSARGRGVGAAVLGDLLGGRAAVLEVDAANASAQRLYERLGFRVAGGDGASVTMRRAAGPATG